MRYLTFFLACLLIFSIFSGAVHAVDLTRAIPDFFNRITGQVTSWQSWTRSQPIPIWPGIPRPITSCVGEGRSVPVIANPPSCCSGLRLIRPKSPGIIGSYGICTAKCGNGICDSATESNYNCPEDCKGECGWCGLECVRKSSGMICPTIAPPEGYECKEINGVCQKVKKHKKCIGDGKIVRKLGYVYGECCEGLHEIASGRRDGVVYCTSEVCGNGKCTALENEWNCPQDCEKACIKDGETGNHLNNDKCCEGLNMLTASFPSGDYCVAPSCPCFICTSTKCGDGVCKSPENKCNCPQDCASTNVTIPGPDLVIAGITWAPTIPTTGENIVFKINIENIGYASTRRGVWYRAKINGTTICDRKYALGLSPGELRTMYCSLAGSRLYKGLPPGEYEIIAEVDYNNQINERNENNNEMHEKFFVYGGLNCTDSDGGKNYYVKGVCVDSSGRHPDYCAASDRNRKVLQEYYCGSDNKCHLTSYECPGICEDAECVDEEGYCYPGADLGKYPEPFVEDGIADFVAVVGSEAPTSDVVAAIDIAAKLFSETNNPGTQPAAKLDTEITDEDKEKNMILVGTKCKNKMIEELAGSYEAVVGCSEWDLPDGQALIRLVPDVFTKGKMLMVVSGTDENAVRAAATVLKNYDSSEYSDYAKGSSLLVIFEDEENIKIINQCEKCTDSDGGLNYYEKGFTKGRREDTGLYDEVWDYCMQGAIIEHYCENNVLKAKDMTCPSGCEDGACIECLNHGNWTRDLSLDCCDGLEFKSDLWDSSLYTCCHPTECAQDTTCVESGTEFSNWKVKCENGKWVNISTCKDSDSGKNYYVKGECVDGASCSAGKCYDYCSDGKINEFYCSAGNVCKMDTFDCPYGCVDGMCREAPVDLDPPEITEESITPNPGKYNKKFFVEAKITDASNIEYVKLRLTHSTLKKEVILNDKGVNGDKSANDGVYSSYFYFNSPKLVGTWEGKIEASDEHANIGYSKQLSLEVTSICVPIIQNGDPRNTIDIVFVPYGFSDSELEIIWPKKVNDYISMPNGFGNLQHVSILDVEPFASMKDKFNFYRVDEYIPIPRSCRYPSCAVSQAVRASGYCPDTDYRVIVVDKGPGAFGAYGWTYFGGPNIFVSSKPNTGHVIVHEFGHAIGRIPDYWQHSNRHPSCIMALNTKPDCWSCYCSSCRNKMKRGINRARR